MIVTIMDEYYISITIIIITMIIVFNMLIYPIFLIIIYKFKMCLYPLQFSDPGPNCQRDDCRTWGHEKRAQLNGV